MKGALAVSKTIGNVLIHDASVTTITVANYVSLAYTMPKAASGVQIFNGTAKVLTLGDGVLSKHTITFDTAPDAGNLTIKVPGYGTTAAIAFNATAAQIQAALRLITGLEKVLVTGTMATPVVIVFDGVNGELPGALTFPVVPTHTATPCVVTDTNTTAGVAFNWKVAVGPSMSTPIIPINAVNGKAIVAKADGADATTGSVAANFLS